MLFTRTIRRTLIFGMVLVVVMLLILSVGGISSLITHSGVVGDLSASLTDRTVRQDLIKEVVRLDEFLPGLTEEGNVGDIQRQDFEIQRGVVWQKLSDYYFDLNELRLDPTREPARQLAGSALQNALGILAGLGTESEMLVSEPNLRTATFSEIQRDVAELQVQLVSIPEFTTGYLDTLKHANRAFDRGMWLMGVSSVVAFLIFIGLIIYGRRCILIPLHKLHQGAMRVALGDFDYRLELPAPEEMSDLADAFNCMTDQFQEIRDDLDQQVRDRFKQLVRSERLAGIGFLSAGVAHEINNPMQAIAFAAESLETRLIEPRCEEERENIAVMRQYLGMIQREASRCQQITRKLLEFSRGNGEARTRNDLTAIVNEVLALIRPMTKYQDRKIVFERTTPCPVEVNGPEIQQVVLNFVSNALEAMESGGTLTISITEQAGQVVLNFRDDGCGMSQDVIENLFEPFFTQRKDGKGTGLGLSISDRIISDHGGTIDASSEGPGKGSSFRVILPRNSFRAGTAA